MRHRHASVSLHEHTPFILPILLLVASVSAFEPVSVHAQGNSANAPGQSNAAHYKVPPLPNGSAQVKIAPGMSEKDWEDAYKETGRPKFKASTVKRSNGNVERD